MSKSFERKCEILSEFWSEYNDYEDFEDFFKNCNVGLPLAFMIDNQLADPTVEGINWIESTWIIFCASFKIDIHEAQKETLHSILYENADNYEYHNPDYIYTE